MLGRDGEPAKPRGWARMTGWRQLLRELAERALTMGPCPAAGPRARGGAENQFSLLEGLVPHSRAEAGCGRGSPQTLVGASLCLCVWTSLPASLPLRLLCSSVCPLS